MGLAMQCDAMTPETCTDMHSRAVLRRGTERRALRSLRLLCAEQRTCSRPARARNSRRSWAPTGDPRAFRVTCPEAFRARLGRNAHHMTCYHDGAAAHPGAILDAPFFFLFAAPRPQWPPHRRDCPL
eukprot:499103-Pyramimonas_sp.AAC.1